MPEEDDVVITVGDTIVELPNSESSNDKTIGLLLANFDYAFYQTKDGKEECPYGLVHTNRENWEAQFPTQAARQAHLNTCGSIKHRGPNCENVWFSPELIEDPLPYREVRGNISYGIDFDGVQYGMAKENTCEHEEFVSPDGEPGIDNQYYRFLGCEKWVRGEYISDEEIKKAVVQWPVYRMLLEVTDVDDESNDTNVEVIMYRSKDSIIVDSAGNAVPWQSHRIDEMTPPESNYHMTGRILNGLLITEPTDVVWEDKYLERRLFIRGMSLRLKLTLTGAEGLRVGYIDAKQLWQSYSDFVEGGGLSAGASGPGAYAALWRLADGYKEQQTGACTALSSARFFKFVRAYIIHPSSETKH